MIISSLSWPARSRLAPWHVAARVVGLLLTNVREVTAPVPVETEVTSPGIPAAISELPKADAPRADKALSSAELADDPAREAPVVTTLVTQ